MNCDLADGSCLILQRLCTLSMLQAQNPQRDPKNRSPRKPFFFLGDLFLDPFGGLGDTFFRLPRVLLGGSGQLASGRSSRIACALNSSTLPKGSMCLCFIYGDLKGVMDPKGVTTSSLLGQSSYYIGTWTARAPSSPAWQPAHKVPEPTFFKMKRKLRF